MCGIAGCVDSTRARTSTELRNIAAAMAECLRHRGPDDAGTFADERIGLAFGFRRLAVQDPSPEGAQPMRSRSGRYIIAYNGEIYNFHDLRSELEREGVGGWRGGSDTEVMLAVIDRHGLASALRRFDGMFAFALYDRSEHTLHFARDRMGEKPLYYGWSGTTFAFGSELKSLASLPGWQPELDRDALAAYMRFAYVPAPRSIYTGICKLLPGHCLSVDLQRLQPGALPEPEAYWDPRSEIETASKAVFSGSEDAAADTLEELLSASISRRLIADVPLGVFLSGGIDSSTVTALASKVSNTPVKTFTIGFEDARFDESAHAERIAAHLGTEHVTLMASPEAPLDLVERMPAVYDEPFADVSQLPTLLLSELTRRHVTVALSGDGGDELFLGYPRYLSAGKDWMYRQSRLGRAAHCFGRIAGLLPARALNRMTFGRRPWRLGDKLSRAAADTTARSAEKVYGAYVTRWRTADPPCAGGSFDYYSRPEHFPDLDDPIDRMAFADTVTYLPDDLLVKIDRATMSTGLEARAPMLDHNFVRFAWSLPLSLKLRDDGGKYLLRRVLYRHVPRQLVDRPKQGFEPPLGDWLRGPLREWAEALLDPAVLESGGPIDPRPVRAAWQEHLAGVRDWRFELWQVLMFQAWRTAWRV